MQPPSKNSFHRLIRSVATFLFLLTAVSAITLFEGSVTATTPSPARAPKAWTIECVDCRPYLDGFGWHSAAFDALGTLHIAYTSIGDDGGLMHSWLSDQGWQHEVVDDSISVASSALLVVDKEAWPHIVYADGELGVYRYAHQTKDGWVVTILPEAILPAAADGLSTLR